MRCASIKLLRGHLILAMREMKVDLSNGPDHGTAAM
jgi:hypothetical protein